MIEIKRAFRPARGFERIDELPGYLFTPEMDAHTFIITKMEKVDGQEAVVPFDAGTEISARLIKADGVTELVDGSLADGAAVVTLPAECYQVPGRFTLTIYASLGGTVTCIYAATSTVLAGDTEDLNIAGGTVRNIDTKIGEIRDAISDAQDAVDDIGEAVAGVPDVIASIPQDYTALTGEVSDLKSAFENATGLTKIVWTEGSYRSMKSAAESNDVAYLDVTANPSPNGGWRHAVLETSPGEQFSISGSGGGPRLYGFVKSSENNYEVIKSSIAPANLITTDNPIIITAPEGAAYLVLNDQAKTSDSYRGVLPVKFNDVPALIDTSSKNLNDVALWESGNIASSTGTNYSASANVRTKDYIKVNSKRIYLQAYYELPSDRVAVASTDNYNMRNGYIFQYKKTGEFIGVLTLSSTEVLTGAKKTLSDDCEYIRISFYTRYTVNGTTTLLSDAVPAVVYYDDNDVDGDNWLPPYYDAYLEEKAEVIKHYMRNESYEYVVKDGVGTWKWVKKYKQADIVPFIFITDEHAPQYNQMRSPAIIHRLSELVHIPAVFSGGDVDQTGILTSVFADALRKAFDGEIHHAVGNHDFMNGNTGTSLYYDLDVYSSNQVGSNDHHYYYVDNAQQKIRYIVLAANRESKSTANEPSTGGSMTAAQGGFTDAQETWVTNVALGTLPAGWNAIVFTHFFYMVEWAQSGNAYNLNANIVNGNSKDIIQAIGANPAVIAVFQGHTHVDRIIKNHSSDGQNNDGVGQMPIIVTGCDKNIPYVHTTPSDGSDDGGDESGNTGSVPMLNRATGTIYEQLFDVVIINREDKVIHLVRIGGQALDGVNNLTGVTQITGVEERTVSYSRE